jgi:3-oxoacyl-[acyl-carrier-protein] synthase-3
VSSAVAAPAKASGPVIASRPRAGIAAIGSALPPGVVANRAIAPGLGVDDEWIFSRTGIRERRHAASDASLVELAARSGLIALQRAGIEVADVDLVLVATTTADDLVPNAAPLVAERLGALGAGAIDVGAACTGFVSALDLAAANVESGRAEVVLAIGADLMSRVLDLDDQRTAGLFGDGAGAAVVCPGGDGAIGAIRLRSDARGARHVTISHADRKLRMDGRATFRAAVARLSEVTGEVVSEAGLGLEDVDLFVYHQANSRILAAVGERLGLRSERVVDTLALHGNTSAASIPIALDVALAEGRLQGDATVLVGAFGGGLTWGAGLVEWGGAG